MRTNVIGFDRRLDLDWLDAVAGKVASGAAPQEVRAFLHSLLEGVVAGSGASSARGKSMTVLMRIWSVVPAECRPLRDRALALLEEADRAERLALHWAMATATYPFFAHLAESAGRLLDLQDEFTLAQLDRRMRERWGERSTVTRATQRVVRSMAQWGALTDGATRGVYKRRGLPLPISAVVAQALVEALLVTRQNQALPVEQATGHPGFFAFQFSVRAHDLRRSEQFEVHRQGLNLDVVELARKEPQGRDSVRKVG